jgi:hypothetical protein
MYACIEGQIIMNVVNVLYHVVAAGVSMLEGGLTPGGMRSGVPHDGATHGRLQREKRSQRIWHVGLPKSLRNSCGIASLNFMQQLHYAHWRGRFCELANTLGYKDADRSIWPPPPVPW